MKYLRGQMLGQTGAKAFMGKGLSFWSAFGVQFGFFGRVFFVMRRYLIRTIAAVHEDDYWYLAYVMDYLVPEQYKGKLYTTR